MDYVDRQWIMWTDNGSCEQTMDHVDNDHVDNGLCEQTMNHVDRHWIMWTVDHLDR